MMSLHTLRAWFHTIFQFLFLPVGPPLARMAFLREALITLVIRKAAAYVAYFSPVLFVDGTVGYAAADVGGSIAYVLLYELPFSVLIYRRLRGKGFLDIRLTEGTIFQSWYKNSLSFGTVLFCVGYLLLLCSYVSLVSELFLVGFPGYIVHCAIVLLLLPGSDFVPDRQELQFSLLLHLLLVGCFIFNMYWCYIIWIAARM